MALLPDPFQAVDRAVGTVRVGVTVVSRAAEAMRVLTSPHGSGLPALAARAGRPSPSLNQKMTGLQRRAFEHSTTSSQAELFHHLVDQLVPDEARILGALSDGSAAPLLHVSARTHAGLIKEAVLENVCLVGRTASVTLPNLTPTYVAHLLTLGLVETGPEDPDLKEDYEILAAETAVLRAIKQAGRGPIPAHIERQTLRLSGLGKALWAAAMAAED